MKNFVYPVLSIFLTIQTIAYCQPSNFQTPVSINEDGTNPDKNAILDIQSSDKGLLIPRMPFCEIEQIADPPEGLMIYDTEFRCLRIYMQDKWHCLYQNLNGPNAETNVTGWLIPTYDDDYNSSIAIDSKENQYVTMVTDDDDTRLIKFDKKGNILWSIFETTGSEHFAATVDLNDYVYTIVANGKFNGLSSPEGGYFITKTSPDGINSSIFPLPDAKIKDVIVDSKGDILFVFTFRKQVTFDGVTYTNDSVSIRKIGIAKLDNNFNEKWVVILDAAIDDPVLYDRDIPVSINVDEEDNIYVAGYHNNGVSPLQIEQTEIKAFNFFITKLNTVNGEHIWVKNNGSDFRFHNLDVQCSNNYVFVGLTEGLKNANYAYEGNAKVFRYDTTYGALYSTLDPPGEERYFNYTVNNEKHEIAMSFQPVTGNSFNTTPMKLLTYNMAGGEPQKVINQTFNYAGDLSYNADGSKIYGIGKGKVIGNALIGRKELYYENHIIYKVYN